MDEQVRRRYDTDEYKLIQKYIRTNRRHRKAIEREVSSTGVYRSQHQLLMYVTDNPNMSQKDLASRYGVSTATIAVSLKKLEQGGYIQRDVDRKDNRYNQIRITEKGQKVVDSSVSIFQRMERTMFQGFTKEDFEKMGQLLDLMYNNMAVYVTDKIETEREDS